MNKKAYECFPVATGMILRTAYEEVLRLRLEQLNKWKDFMQTVQKNRFPTLKAMEQFVTKNDQNKIFETPELLSAINSIITYRHRDFLNANIHNPGAIKVSPDALSGMAQAGMFTLIQGLINLL
jgi:hypothetical protein